MPSAKAACSPSMKKHNVVGRVKQSSNKFLRIVTHSFVILEFLKPPYIRLSMANTPDFSNRQTDHDVNSLFVQRWSPRAFQPFEVDAKVMGRIVEAARWAPSCFNAQPWRVHTSTDDTFDQFLNLLVDGNQTWAKGASVLGFIVAENNFEHNGKPNAYAQFDCGAAWMAMSLQARMEGLYTHGMGGIHADKAADYLKVDTNAQTVVMGFAVGKLADLSELPQDQQQAETPNARKPLSEIWLTS